MVAYIVSLSSVYIVDIELVNVCWKPVLWHSYTGVERRHCSTVVIVNFEHIISPCSVHIVDFELVLIFWVSSNYISTVLD